MAQKRMFDRSIIETDNFLNISLTSKALYFLLGMEADDEGFISPKRVMRLYGGEIGDLKNLIDTGLLIPFKTGVVVITDWNQNNWLDNRRIKPTQYQLEKKMLIVNEQRRYLLSNGLATAKTEEYSIEESRGVEKSIDIAAYAALPAKLPKKKKEKVDPNTPMDLSGFIEWCKKSKQRHVKIISDYAEEKKVNFTTRGQWEVFIGGRNAKAAAKLAVYTDDQIGKAITEILKAEKDYLEKWTLETVLKYLTK